MRYLVKPGRYNTVKLFDEMDQLWNSVWGRNDISASGSYPRVDIRENKDGYIIEADIPGWDENAIDIKVEENRLTVSAEVSTETKKEENDYLVKERNSSSFSRSFALPKDADKENINASYKNGVLTLDITKVPEAQPRKISIKSN